MSRSVSCSSVWARLLGRTIALLSSWLMKSPNFIMEPTVRREKSVPFFFNTITLLRSMSLLFFYFLLFHTGTHIIPISAYRTEGITAIWTTFDVDLYHLKPETSGSARKLCWIPISLFSTTTVDEICESLGELFAKPHSRFAVSLLSGHPRSIAALKNVLSEYLNIDFISFPPTRDSHFYSPSKFRRSRSVS